MALYIKTDGLLDKIQAAMLRCDGWNEKDQLKYSVSNADFDTRKQNDFLPPGGILADNPVAKAIQPTSTAPAPELHQ